MNAVRLLGIVIVLAAVAAMAIAGGVSFGSLLP